MDTLLNAKKYERFYNCSLYNYEQIPFAQRQQRLGGGTALCLSVLLIALYIPCLYAIGKSNLLKVSCYKIMFFMGFVDISAILMAGVSHGIFGLAGVVFCQWPTTMYLVGLVATNIYYLEQATDCLLALDRLFIMISRDKLAKMFFDGKKTFIWFGAIFVFPVYLFITQPPFFYNPMLNSWTPNPHFGYLAHLDKESEEFYNFSAIKYYSCVVISIFVCIYASFMVMFVNRRKQVKTEQYKADIKVFFQVFWISLLCTFVCLSYAFSDYITPKFPFVIPLYTYGYIIYQGSPPVIYLILNDTIRKEVLGSFKTGATTVFPITRNLWRQSQVSPAAETMMHQGATVAPAPTPILAQNNAMADQQQQQNK